MKMNEGRGGEERGEIDSESVIVPQATLCVAAEDKLLAV